MATTTAARPARCPVCDCLPLEWLKAADVARKLCVHRVTVYRMIEDGRLAGIRFGRVQRIRHYGSDPNGIPGLHEFLSQAENSPEK